MINNQTKKYSYAIKNHGTFEIITSDNKNLHDSKIVTKNFKLSILGKKKSVENSEKIYLFDWQEVSFMAIIDPIKEIMKLKFYLLIIQ